MRFYKTDLDKELLIAKIKKNPSLLQIFKKQKYITKQLNEDIRLRMRGEIENFVTIFITGQQGCQPKGSKVLMANGEWKNIEDIKIGDKILSPQKDEYEIGRVTGTCMFESHTNYLIKTSDKWKRTLYECSYNHLIPMNKTHQPRINKKDDNKRNRIWKRKNFTAEELHKKSKTLMQHMTTILAPPIPKFENRKNCEIEPYTLGYWLGDGSFTKCSLSISSAEKEPLKYINKHYKISNIINKKGSTCKNYAFSSIGKLAKQLKKYGLHNKKSGNKFIPKEALLSDIEYRKKLFAGLIDSDGHFARKKCSLSITTKSNQLTKDICTLANSLGLRNSAKKYKSHIKSINFTGIYNDICIYVNGINIPNLLKRKNPNTPKFYLSSNRKAITLKKKKGSLVYGFTIDTESKLYITDNWVVTHNSWKSSTGQEIATINDETKFRADKVCFTYQEFRDKFEKSKPKEWFIQDEQVFLHGVGSGRIVESIQTLIETLRQRQNSMIVISPEGKYFPESIFTYVMETIDRSILGRCKHNNNLHEIRTCPHRPHIDIEATVRLAVKKENVYIGFYTIPITWKTQIWQEYYKRKVEFTRKVLTEDFQKIDYERLAKEVMSLPNNKDYKTHKQLKLLLEKKYPNLAVGEKDLIIEEIVLTRKRLGE